MTSHTATNVDVLIMKLKIEIKGANRGTFTTCKVALLEMAVRALEQQQAEIAALKAPQTEHIGLAVSVPVEA